MHTANFPISQLDPASNGVFSGYNNPLAQFFGPELAPPMTNPHEKRYRDKLLVVDGKADKSYYLGETFVDLLLTADRRFLTERFLPYRPAPDNNIHFSWRKFEYNVHLMRNQPSLTASHLMTQRMYSRQASLLRKGIAFEIENDFYQTAEGRASFIAYVRQGQIAVQETANLMCMDALLHAAVEDDNYRKQNMTITDKTLREQFEYDRDNFAIVQKEVNGLEKANDDMSAELQKHGGYADAFIMDSEVKRYLKWRPHSTEYWLAGYRGPDIVNTAYPLDSPVPTAFVQESPVFIFRSRHAEGVPESDALGRIRQTGSYNTARDECEDYNHYTTASRSRQVYDEDIDDWKTMTLYDFLEHCGLWTKEGNLRMIRGKIREQEQLAALDRDPFIYTTSEKGDNVERKPVEYLGDMDLQYLPTKTLLNCVKTLDNALRKKMGETKYNEFRTGLQGLQEEEEAEVEAVEGEEAPAGVEEGRVGRKIYNLAAVRNLITQTKIKDHLKSILGDNLFNLNNARDINTFTAGVIMATLMPGGVPVKDDTEAAARPEDYEGLKEVQSRLYTVMKAATPSVKRDEIDAILENPKKLPTEEIAEIVHNKLRQYMSDPTIKTAKDKGAEFKKFKSVDDVSKFFNDRMVDYKKKVANLTKDAPKTKSGVVGYMMPGQNLSGSKYSYVHAASARRNDAPAATIPLFREAMDKAADQRASAGRGARGYVDRGQGMGFSGIGMVADYDRPSQLKRRRNNADENWPADRFRMIGHHVQELQKVGPSRMESVLALSFLGMRFTKQNMLRLAHHDVCVPIDFLLLRPHQQRHTKAIIKAATGGKTGYTFFALPDVMVGSSAVTKYTHVNITMHLRPIVTSPQNVRVMRDAMATGYYGGNGTKFYSPESYRQVNWKDIENSIICVAIPVTETQIGNKQGTMDISGKFGSSYLLRKMDKTQVNRLGQEGPHYSTFYRYNSLYNFDSQTKRGSAHPNRAATKLHLNRVCEPAGQRKRGRDGEWLKPSVNRDHFGQIIGPGSAEIRRGKKKYVMGMKFER